EKDVMNIALEIQAHELEANCEQYLNQVVNGATLIVIIDGQRTLQISSTHPSGTTYALGAFEFECRISDYALLVALHGRTYRLPLASGSIFITRAHGYYS